MCTCSSALLGASIGHPPSSWILIDSPTNAGVHLHPWNGITFPPAAWCSGIWQTGLSSANLSEDAIQLKAPDPAETSMTALRPHTEDLRHQRRLVPDVPSLLTLIVELAAAVIPAADGATLI